MKKNINKIIAIGIGLTIMSGSIIPVFAEETTENNKNISTSISTNESNSIVLGDSIINKQTSSAKQILTLDKIITAAIDNSDRLNLKIKEKNMYGDKMDLQETTDDFYDSIGRKVYDYAYDKLELQEKQTDQSKEFMEDQIANNITNKYNAVILKEIDVNKLKTNLEIKTKDFNTIKTKVSIGLATSNQLNDSEIEIKKLQDDMKAKEDSLKNNMDYLGVLTNLNLSDYTLDPNIDYETLKIDGSVDEYLNNKIDTYLKYNDEIVALTKDYFKELKDDDKNDLKNYLPTKPDTSSDSFNTTNNTTGEKTFNTEDYALAYVDYIQQYLTGISSYASYLEGRYSIAEAQVKLDESKKSLKNGLKESYSALLDLENKITRLKEDIKSTNTKLRDAKTKVDIGMMTENAYKAQVLKSQDLDTSLRNLINTYNTLKNSIEKPWILSSN